MEQRTLVSLQNFLTSMRGNSQKKNYDNGKEKKEECGRISIIDPLGTFEQKREVSYDIESTDRILYKHIPESDVYGFYDVMGDN